MTDQKFREIQLGGKQIVFLFMAALVVAVAVFLLGISVGRGVRNASGEGAGTEVAVATPQSGPADMPPPTVTTPADLQYHDQLQGQNTPPAETSSAAPAKATGPAATADAPPAVAEPSSTESSRGAAGATVKASPSAKPAEKAAATTPAKPDAPAVPTVSGWFVQVNAFKSRDNAERQVARLKAKGFSAAAVSPSGGLFRVRVGPFAQRSEADQVAARLQREEGLKPSVQP